MSAAGGRARRRGRGRGARPGGARRVARVAAGRQVRRDWAPPSGSTTSRARPEHRGCPSLRLATAAPFTSDLTAPDFVTLLRAGYRPIAVAMGACVYGLDPAAPARLPHAGRRGERVHAGVLRRARDGDGPAAAGPLRAAPAGDPDTPAGIVGVTVTEEAYGGGQTAPIVEFNAIGTAVAELAPNDPRRGPAHARPHVVVPLDR